jgi:DNA modification methylase
VIKPYYEDKYSTIYLGDCREVLPHLPKMDLVLTDPPYGIGEARGRNKTRGCLATSKDYGNASWDDEPIDEELLKMVRKAGDKQIIFGGNYFPLREASCWLIWDKDNGETDFADCEMAWTNLGGAVRMLKYKWQGMLQQHMGQLKEDRWHPTQKPQIVMRWCIEKAEQKLKAKIQTILDPFMGSGTTLVAAKNLGRKGIGIEICEAYCEIAVKRLAQGVFDFGGATS